MFTFILTKNKQLTIKKYHTTASYFVFFNKTTTCFREVRRLRWPSHNFQNVVLFDSWYSWHKLEEYFGSLSCWKMIFFPIMHKPDSIVCYCKNEWYCSFFMIPLTIIESLSHKTLPNHNRLFIMLNYWNDTFINAVSLLSFFSHTFSSYYYFECFGSRRSLEKILKNKNKHTVVGEVLPFTWKKKNAKVYHFKAFYKEMQCGSPTFARSICASKNYTKEQ